mmetsp:Transcript_20878/g.64734  ORF Transcript_20878/g.64734 Transcript_20878/m.64734 type:complete len:405 (+) Transcript_20878:144-1358(+)
MSVARRSTWHQLQSPGSGSRPRCHRIRVPPGKHNLPPEWLDGTIGLAHLCGIPGARLSKPAVTHAACAVRVVGLRGVEVCRRVEKTRCRLLRPEPGVAGAQGHEAVVVLAVLNHVGHRLQRGAVHARLTIRACAAHRSVGKLPGHVQQGVVVSRVPGPQAPVRSRHVAAIAVVFGSGDPADRFVKDGDAAADVGDGLRSLGALHGPLAHVPRRRVTVNRADTLVDGLGQDRVGHAVGEEQLVANDPVSTEAHQLTVVGLGGGVALRHRREQRRLAVRVEQIRVVERPVCSVAMVVRECGTLHRQLVHLPPVCCVFLVIGRIQELAGAVEEHAVPLLMLVARARCHGSPHQRERENRHPWRHGNRPQARPRAPVARFSSRARGWPHAYARGRPPLRREAVAAPSR